MKKSIVQKAVLSLAASLMFFHSSALIHASATNSQPAVIFESGEVVHTGDQTDARQSELKDFIETILRLSAEAAASDLSGDAASEVSGKEVSKGWHAVFKILLVLYTHDTDAVVETHDQADAKTDAADSVTFERAVDDHAPVDDSVNDAPVDAPVVKAPANAADAAVVVSGEISVKTHDQAKAKKKADKKKKHGAAFKNKSKHGDDEDDDDDDDHHHDGGHDDDNEGEDD